MCRGGGEMGRRWEWRRWVRARAGDQDVVGGADVGEREGRRSGGGRRGGGWCLNRQEIRRW